MLQSPMSKKWHRLLFQKKHRSHRFPRKKRRFFIGLKKKAQVDSS
jgi:hypothetical protein